MSEETPSPPPTASHGTPPRQTGSGSRPSIGWEPPSPEELQAQFPQFEIRGLLGRGGMGAVYKGWQTSLDRPVAIKILPPDMDDGDSQFTARFKQEARTMAKFSHPGIVAVYAAGETASGLLYIVMEFIEGTDVARMVSSQGKLPPAHALAITAHVCDALQYAHSQGVIHRDIKPANIMLNMDGEVKVADFGLAKAGDRSQSGGLTKTNMAMGTPDYVAPEALITGMQVDQRADLYAIGVMLYNMLTGEIPRGIFRPPSQKVGCDARFDRIIIKAMEQDREHRYQSALEIRRDLDVILTTPEVKAEPQAQAGGAVRQKPVAKGPQPRNDGSPAAAGQAVSEKAQRRGAGAAPAPVGGAPRKSGAGMFAAIVGGVAVVGIGAFFAFRKPRPAAESVSERAPATALPSVDSGRAGSPSAAPTAAVEERWIDALAAWWGGTKTNEVFVRESNGAAKSTNFGTMTPVPASAPPFRDMAVRAKARLAGANGFRVQVRRAVDASGNVTGYSARLERNERRVRLGCYAPGKQFQALGDFRFPSGFDPDAGHALELRVVGDLLTVSLDGKKLGERRDTTLSAGYPAFLTEGKGTVVESFEYAVLDRGGAAPLAAPVPAAPVKPGEVLTFAGHRYQLVREKLKWDEAKARAEAMGGHLAAITSKAENDWVWGQIVAGLKRTADDPDGDRCFIGAFNRSAPAGPWQWVTGEAFIIQPWMDRFANDKDGGDKVLAMFHRATWDDVNRSSKSYYFLVEWDDDSPGKMALPVASPALTGPVNLLARVDLQRDVVQGKWATVSDGLRAQPDTIDGKLQPVQVLGFDQVAPEEYDFEVEFTVTDGDMNVCQILPLAGGSILWKMGATKSDPALFAFGPKLDGRDPGDAGRTEAMAALPRFKKRELCRSLVEVRKSSLRVLLDGKEIVKWSGDLKRFTGEERFALPDAAHPGIACFNTIVFFHKAELRPVPPAGGDLPAAAPSPSSPTPPTPAPATGISPPPESDRRLAQLEAGFQARYEADAQKPFLAAVAALNRSYVANGIGRARSAAQGKGDLEEVIALDAEKALIEKGGTVPAEDAPGTPESLKALRMTYRAELARHEAARAARAAPLLEILVKALDDHLAELGKAGKTDQAARVRAVRDARAAEAGAKGGAPKPAGESPAPGVGSPAGSASGAPVPFSPADGVSSWRRAADWWLGTGGTMVVLKGGTEVKVAKPDDLPAGRFDIVDLTLTASNATGRPAPTDADFAVLNGQRNLRRVVVVAEGLSDSAFAFLRGNDALDVVRLLAPVGKSMGITDGLLAHLAEAKKIQHFEVDRAAGFTGVSLAGAPFRDSLKWVELLRSGITAEGLKAAAGCRQIGRLNLLNAKVTDAACLVLGGMKSLRDLDVEGTGFGDEAAAAIAALPELQALNIERTRVTESGLAKLAALKKLRTLRVSRGNAQISAAALDALRQALPGCQIR